MNLADLINRNPHPEPWAEGEKIPWNDPAFSSRMLHEHLSQDHDAASRRTEIIDQHVDWLHTEILDGKAAKVLDLCCGPGLYTTRLARLGHTCVGIDFGPASVAHARQQAIASNLECAYMEADIRKAEFGTGYALVMMIHGELNVFRPEETWAILEKARRALTHDGQLVVEVHTRAVVRAIGEQGQAWSALDGGLFSDRPHLLLKETFWYDRQQVAIERYYVVDAQNGSVIRHAASTQAYTDMEYEELLEQAGFIDVRTHRSLGGKEGMKDRNYTVFVARASRAG
jgi:SAM-dependent methyltransferase